MSHAIRKPFFRKYKKQRRGVSYTVTKQLINTFVFHTKTVQFLYFLNSKFQASSHLLWLYCLVHVWLGNKPKDRFSHDVAQLYSYKCQRMHTQTSLICSLSYELRHKKPGFCINRKNKDADQLRGNRKADQRLCFRHTDSTIPLLPKSEISSF